MVDSPQSQLIPSTRTCNMAELIKEAKSCVTADPAILDMIDTDVDGHDLRLKEMRLADAQWIAEHSPPASAKRRTGKHGPSAQLSSAKVSAKAPLPSLFWSPCLSAAASNRITDAMRRDRLIDSTAFHALLDEYQIDGICPTVLARHLNNLTHDTVKHIWDIQITSCRDEKLDGYSSKANWQVATGRAYGMQTMSTSGAKRRKVIGEALWDRDDYREARRLRGLMESPIFVLKHVNGVTRMRRAGVAAVRLEIIEKIIAYNAVRAVQLRKRATAKARRRRRERESEPAPALRSCA